MLSQSENKITVATDHSVGMSHYTFYLFLKTYIFSIIATYSLAFNIPSKF